ncbi:MAG: hypothetical protein RL112_1399 [Planctomycetota bacterium]
MTGYAEAALRMWNVRRHDLAAECYEKHLAVKPRDARAIIRLAQVLWLAGRKEAARARSAEALELAPEDCDVQQGAGRIHLWEDDWRKALEHFDKAVALHPWMAQHHLHRAYALEKGKRVAEAFAAVPRALELDPRDPDNHQEHVYLHMQHGKLEDAWALCQEYLRLSPDRADAHARRGWCLEKLGRLEESQQAYLDSLALDPRLEWAKGNLAILRERMEREAPRIAAAEASTDEPVVEAMGWLDSLGLGSIAFGVLLAMAALFFAMLAWTASAAFLGVEEGWTLVACLHACLCLALAPWNHEYLVLLRQRMVGAGVEDARLLLGELPLHVVALACPALVLAAIAQSSWPLAYVALGPLALLPCLARLLGPRHAGSP